ncbi:hypothetical protein TWF718_006262 [Orbilia javanica]|uniref:Uncharacterized protein n=1 Tax=Orbilia javanica TaxID=47235 RepID=A0AAN8MT71_9PEZI
MGTPGFLKATSSLQAFLTPQAVRDWFSGLPLASGPAFVVDNQFNDRISNFLEQNWTMSPWFQDFIQTIVDRKLDSDLSTYFTSLDPLWDLWDDSQRAKELNSQLLAEPAHFTEIHVSSFLWGAITAGFLLVVLIPILLFTLYCLYGAICYFYKGKKNRIGGSYKRSARSKDTIFGADIPPAIWENLVLDPPNIPRKRLKTGSNWPCSVAQGACMTPLKASESTASAILHSNEDMGIPESPTSSSDSTITAAFSEGILEGNHLTKEDDIDIPSYIKAININPRHQRGSEASSDRFQTKDGGVNGFVEYSPDVVSKLEVGSPLNSGFSDVWLAEAFTTVSEITSNSDGETAFSDPEIKRAPGRARSRG